MNEDNNEEMWKERCEDCIRCSVIEDCRVCNSCRSGKKCEQRRCFSAKKLYNEKIKRQADENMKQILAKTAVREAAAAGPSTSSAAPSTAPPAPEPEKKKRGRKKGSVSAAAAAKKITERDYVPNRPTRQHAADLRRKRTQINSQPEQEKEPRQCLQPDCIFEARMESKYCSDECGRILAKMRLTEVLPQRCAEYFEDRRPHEQEVDRKRNLINKEMQDMTTAEKNMLRFLEKLHEYIEKLSRCTPEATEETCDDNLVEACVVCGQADIPLRRYAKHIDICWSRSEKAISFGAPEKNNETFYCEKYDARTKTYCKRLKSLCPEHRKAGVEEFLKICGFPKIWENSVGPNAKTFAEMIEQEDPFGTEGCMAKKDGCLKHHKWLPTLRGSIELEQACLFQKMFELCHETVKLKNKVEWTNNALNILMYEKPIIVDPEEYEKFKRDQQKKRAADEAADLQKTAAFLAALKAPSDDESEDDVEQNPEENQEEDEGIADPEPMEQA